MKNKIGKNHTLLLLMLFVDLPAHAVLAFEPLDWPTALDMARTCISRAYLPTPAIEKKHRTHKKKHRRHKKKPHATVPSLQVLAIHACTQQLNTEDDYANLAQLLVKSSSPDDLNALLHTPFDEPPLVKQKSWIIGESDRVGIIGNFAAIANYQLVRVFSSRTGNQSSGALSCPTMSKAEDLPAVGHTAFSRCGRWVAALLKGQSNVYLWNIGSGKLATLSVPGMDRRWYWNIGLTFSPSGSRLAYAFSRTDITGKYPSYKYCDSCWFNIWETDQSKPPHTFRHDCHGKEDHYAHGKIFLTNEFTLAHLESRYPKKMPGMAAWEKAMSINLIDIQTGRQKSALRLRIDYGKLGHGGLKLVQAPNIPHIFASLLLSGDVLLCDTKKSSPVQFALKNPPLASCFPKHPINTKIAFGPGAHHLAVSEEHFRCGTTFLSLYALNAHFTEATHLWRISLGHEIYISRLWLTSNCLWRVDRTKWHKPGSPETRLSFWQPSPEFKLGLAIANKLAEQEKEKEKTQETTA